MLVSNPEPITQRQKLPLPMQQSDGKNKQQTSNRSASMVSRAWVPWGLFSGCVGTNRGVSIFVLRQISSFIFVPGLFARDLLAGKVYLYLVSLNQRPCKLQFDSNLVIAKTLGLIARYKQTLSALLSFILLQFRFRLQTFSFVAV